MAYDGHYEPYLKQLSRSLDRFAEALLAVPVENEQQLLDELRRVVEKRNEDQNFNGDGLLRETDSPKATLNVDVMGKSTSYCFEMPTAFGTVGMSLVTNLDATPDQLNRFAKLVPVYVVNYSEVNFFHQVVTLAMEYNLSRHLIEIAYRLSPETDETGALVQRLNLYRQLLTVDYGYTNDDVTRLIASFPTTEDAVSYLKGLINGSYGAHGGQRETTLFTDESKETLGREVLNQLASRNDGTE